MSGWVLRGAVVLVTGASGGIGAAVVRMLASEGARVVLTGRRGDELDRLCGELRAGGAEATAIPGDLVTPDVPARLVREAAGWGGGLHGIVSCAGGGPFSLFARIDEPAFAAAIRVNLLAPIELVRAALPLLTQQRRSWVVFVNTIAAREPAPPRGSAYLSAKAGLVHFAESVFAEIRDDGVTVSSILPDLTDTPMIPDALGYDRSSLIQPASVAEAVRFVMTRAEDACVTELHLRPQPSLRRTSR